ncbi:MepB family protein [Staphylococcus sp. NRL 16/872]|uniref:MepB family protein n=1 Tax=Staphylococcus sp. NRL 16/872 TaxID=2930131 RepID=UPI001FB3C09A|nr:MULTISPECIES: MepB family protein [unclassified Staphylococcus]MCJ1655237.1 MepB family protein [Staphylococcus sp. NRL 21/187]MCJ1661070.1 MepB family protein [Staphylococcus sp. NRL 18/288]MCJ1666968.1 MepB family protein [Staphylococcus sp. NRL 19/737]WEN69440.1 MepB family protein [Staphylococcus sp. NRL 16/872]
MEDIEAFHSYKLLKQTFSTSEATYGIQQWNQQYEALEIETSNGIFTSRLAQKTPNKKGYFFAIWKKDENNKNEPYEAKDLNDALIVNIVDGHKSGQFIFPKEVLLDKGILKSDTSKGKMALRVYPPWETELNKTALKTQQWQCDYFKEMSYE